MEDPKIENVESERLPIMPRVLIVEDEKGIYDLLCDILEGKADVEEGSYQSAQEAIKMLQERKPGDPKFDLLITDLGLLDGKHAGILVAEAFRDKFPESSIVFLTGTPAEIDGIYTLQQKKDLHIEVWNKPIRMTRLRDKVTKVRNSINKNPLSNS